MLTPSAPNDAPSRVPTVRGALQSPWQPMSTRPKPIAAPHIAPNATASSPPTIAPVGTLSLGPSKVGLLMSGPVSSTDRA